MSVIDDVKSRLDLVELISETVKLRKSGRTFTGLCPFHPHKNNTPSFAVWPESGNWRCFGQCNEGGDGFKFIMKRDGVDFAEALRILAQRTGVTLTPRTPAQQEQDDNLDHLRRLLDDSVTYFHHLLRNAPHAQHARDHLTKRGLTDKAVEMFQLGYALDTWDAALKYLTSKGYAQQDLLDAGLIVVKEEDGKAFDRFRDRLMIPVRDDRGRMTGYQARALQPDAIPKFMNSPQTALFDKGRTLFGLDRARKPMRDAGAAIVVEGNLDVIAAHQAGFANVVSSQGTALTEHQMRLLKKHAPRIILALDADEAGDTAVTRALDIARSTLIADPHGAEGMAKALAAGEASWVIGADPTKLLKFETILSVDLYVLKLPLGRDPDEVILDAPDEWRHLVNAAKPLVQFAIDEAIGLEKPAIERPNLRDPKAKADVLRKLLLVIREVVQPVERDAYRQQVMRLLHLDEREMEAAWLELQKAAYAPRRKAQKRAQSPANITKDPASDTGEGDTSLVKAIGLDGVSKLEAYCLGALLRQPDLLYKADRELQAQSLPKLSADDFLAVEHQLIFNALTAALEQVDVEPVEYVEGELDSSLAPRLAALLAEEPPPEAASRREMAAPSAERTAEALMTGVLRLRKRTIANWLHELRFLAEDAREQGDVRAEALQQEIQTQALALAGVDRALARRGKRGEAHAVRMGLR